MQTHLSPDIQNTPAGKAAESILRSCVHCGFCNATCPTYQLLGDENDGPRGRIYLIKQMLEGKQSAAKTLTHLDRCLTCRSCETTCPSGVQYAKLLEIGRQIAETQIKRPPKELALRKLLRKTLPYPKRFSTLLGTARLIKPALPGTVKQKIPQKRRYKQWPQNKHNRFMLILDGCVQPSLSPDINAATANLLDRLGIHLKNIPQATCCGAVSQHLNAEEEAQRFMRQNIDAWWPEIERGAEAIISTASGCGAVLKEYHHYLQHDVDYAEKARRISELCKDISEIIMDEDSEQLKTTNVDTAKKLAWHPPCTLQHAQKITGHVETILTRAGYTLVPVADQYLCCGSAGTYSILQADLAQQLRQNKLENLQKHQPEMIVTANIGCQTHLQEATELPVVHWITLLDSA